MLSRRYHSDGDASSRSAFLLSMAPSFPLVDSHSELSRHGPAPRAWAPMSVYWIVVCACSLSPAVAYAHLFPAEAPVFDSGPCIRRLDKGEVTSLAIPYMVPKDDTEFDPEDIMLEDSKTHQFFALRGALAPDGMKHLFFAFDSESDATAMPIWVNTSDMKRAATAVNGDMLLPDWSEAEVPAEMTLDAHEVLASRFVRITGDDGRVPITQSQARQGVAWDLSKVEPGVYTIAGYIFSPPANGWAPAAGVVTVHEGGDIPPAVVLKGIRSVLLGSRGVRVTACVDAPAGSELRLEHQWVEDASGAWETSLVAPLSGEAEFEHCLTPPRGRSGAMRLRATVVTPDGRSMVSYTPDTATVLASAGTCEVSGNICCPEGESSDAEASGQASSPPEAGAPAMQPDEPVPQAGTETAAAAQAPASMREDGGGSGCGCRVVQRRSWPSNLAAAATIVAFVCTWVRRGGRRASRS